MQEEWSWEQISPWNLDTSVWRAEVSKIFMKISVLPRLSKKRKHSLPTIKSIRRWTRNTWVQRRSLRNSQRAFSIIFVIYSPRSSKKSRIKSKIVRIDLLILVRLSRLTKRKRCSLFGRWSRSSLKISRTLLKESMIRKELIYILSSLEVLSSKWW